MEEVELDQELVEELRQSKAKFGALAPIILDKHGKIVEGHHRSAADPNWPKVIYEEIETDEDRVLYAIAFNWHRREKTENWKTRMLAWLARHGNSVDQIAERTGLSKRTVYRYLPTGLKGPEPEELSRARLSREVEKPTVPCESCGTPVSEPVHVQGKFYCQSCVEKISRPPVEPQKLSGGWIKCDGCGLLTKGEPDSEGKVYCSKCRAKKIEEPKPGVGFEPVKEEPASSEREFKPPTEDELEGPEEIDTGFEWTCPEEGQKFHLIHVNLPGGKVDHRLERWPS